MVERPPKGQLVPVTASEATNQLVNHGSLKPSIAKGILYLEAFHAAQLNWAVPEGATPADHRWGGTQRSERTDGQRNPPEPFPVPLTTRLRERAEAEHARRESEAI